MEMPMEWDDSSIGMATVPSLIQLFNVSDAFMVAKLQGWQLEILQYQQIVLNRGPDKMVRGWTNFDCDK